MNKFARIFELEDNAQVLLVCYYEPSKDTYFIKISTLFDGILAEFELSFNNEKAPQDILNMYDEESARNFREEVSKSIARQDNTEGNDGNLINDPFVAAVHNYKKKNVTTALNKNYLKQQL